MADRRASRHRDVAASIATQAVDALLVTHMPNIRWLTGFTGSSALLLVTATRMTLITDFRYATQAAREAGTVADVQVEPRNVWERLKRAVESIGVEALGVEAQVLTVQQATRLSGLVRSSVVPLTDVVERLRETKDADEVAAIRRAVEVAHAALEHVLPSIRAGERELDVAARLESALRERGSEWHPFHTIVASGPRSALPHAGTSEREISRGEFLLIDFGAQVDGYCADLTRTFVIGHVDERQRQIYELVREAQMRARSGVRAGMTGRDADALARDLIASRGFGDAFGHSLGHGLGLEVHEAPRLAATAEAVLPASAVVTIEPGIYLPGWGGVRLEDDVWLADDGPVLLTDGRTELIILDE